MSGLTVSLKGLTDDPKLLTAAVTSVVAYVVTDCSSNRVIKLGHGNFAQSIDFV